MHGQLLAQLRGLGVGARHRHAAFRIGDACAFIELLDAALGGRERVAQLFDERRRRRQHDGAGCAARDAIGVRCGPRLRRDAATARAWRTAEGLAALPWVILAGDAHRRHLVRAAVIDVVGRFGLHVGIAWHLRGGIQCGGRSRSASAHPSAGTQESVCAMESFSVDSYAATSSTGNSAVASLSTSDGDALVFTGGIAGDPQIFVFCGDSSPRPAADGCRLFALHREMRMRFSVLSKPPNSRPPNLRKPDIGLWLRPMDNRPSAPAPRLLRVPPRPTSRP